MLLSVAGPHLVILLGVLMAVFSVGKDLNWDQYNYHLYLPHAFLNDRFPIDVMTASTNTHLNPLPYLPFYWMAMSNWHSFAVAGVLGAFHGLSVSLIWTLSLTVWFAHLPTKKSLSIFSTILAAIAPIYLALIGASFLEATLSVFTLAGILLACWGVNDLTRQAAAHYILVAGLVLGSSMGFKLTGIVFATGLGFALLVCIPMRLWVSRIGPYVIGLLAGYALTNGWLMVKLWGEFGNPVFPFFNGYFQSPDFLPVNLSHDRFRWNSFRELLSLPFSMALPLSWVYVEPNLPDSRPGILTIACAALIGRTLFERLRTKFSKDKSSPEVYPHSLSSGTGAHAGIKLTIYFVVATLPFWLITSANSRYGLPLFLLCGPMLVLALSRLIVNTSRLIQFLLVIVFWQTVQLAFVWPPRWDVTEWTPSWYDPQIPQRLLDEPYGYVSLGETHSNSFIVPFLHSHSAFTSIAGATLTIAPEAPSSTRHREFLSKHRTKLRTLYAVRTSSNRIYKWDKRYMDEILAPWALRIDYTDCEFITIKVEKPGLKTDLYKGDGSINLSDRLENVYDTRLVACRIVPGPGESAEVQAERARVSRVFDKIELYCPLLFSPRGWYLSKDATGWKRHYLRSDIVLHASQDQIGLRRDLFGPFDVRLGSLEQWERGQTPFTCKRLTKHWQIAIE
jgi:hypothetical protein